MRKHRAKSQVENVRASKARSLWSVVGGLSRRPVAGDILKDELTNEKCCVYDVRDTGVYMLPYGPQKRDYLHGRITPHGLKGYTWVENLRQVEPSNVPAQPRDQ